MKKFFIALISAILSCAILLAFAGCTPNEKNNDNTDGNNNSFSDTDDTSSDEDTVSVITDIKRFSGMGKQADKIDVDYDNCNGKIIPFSITDAEEIAELMDVIFKASLYKLSDRIPPGNNTRITIYQGTRSYTFSVCYVEENGKNYAFPNSLLMKISDIAGAHEAYAYLNDFYSWIDELNVEDIVKVRCEYSHCIPGMLNNISYSTNSVDVQSAYRLLFSPLKAITEEESHVAGGGLVKYDFYTADNVYSVTVGTNMVRIENQYYKFVDTFYYAFQYPDLECYSFDTYILDDDEYEIYTYANESVKVGDFDGLGEFEFCLYDGLIENVPHFYLRGSVNLLILSPNQFMIEGDDNTVVYRITGEKDFSALFADNNE